VTALPGRLRTGLALPILFFGATLVALLALGVWQLQRKTWKESLIAKIEQRQSAAPVWLPPPARWGELDPERDDYRRVRAALTFIHGSDALVFAGTALPREFSGGLGYWVFTPARLAGGEIVVVNRGLVPEDRRVDHIPASVPSHETEIVAVMRWPEQRSLFTPPDNPAKNLWFVRDHVAMAAAKAWGKVAPFFLDLESPQPPDGWPRPMPSTVRLRNEHLQYAVTWFGLAGVWAAMFALWVKSRSRRI